MIRITRRRSLATLTVVAGLFGAAAPAFAAPAPFVVDGPFTAKAPSGFSWSETQTGSHSVTAPAATPFLVDGPYSAKAPSSFSWSETQTGSSLIAPTPTSFVVDGPITLKATNIAGDGIGA